MTSLPSLSLCLSLSLACLLLLLTGCSRETAGPTAPPPRITLAETAYEAGEVEQGEVIRHQFSVRNDGGRDLHISKTRASCACTIAIEGSRILAPGTEDGINIAFDTSLASGPLERTFSIYTNDPVTPVSVIRISATILPHVELSPKELYVGRVLPGLPATAEAQIGFPLAPNTRAVAAKSYGPVSRPWLATKDDAGDVFFGVTIATDAEPGPFSEMIRIRTTHSSHPIITTKVAGIVLPRPSLEP